MSLGRIAVLLVYVLNLKIVTALHEKVIFSVMSVCSQVEGGGFHVTIIHDATYLTKTGSATGPRHPLSTGIPLLVKSFGQDWRAVQTYSLEDQSPAPLLTSGGYCSTYCGRGGL